MVKTRGKKLWKLMTMISLLLTAAMAAYVLVMYCEGFTENAQDTIYQRYYMMITEDSKSSLWKSVYQGASEQAEETGVYVDFLSSALPEYSVSQLMEIAAASAVDGIIVTANESDEMTQLIDEAVSRGIPVVTLYGDNTKSGRCSFVGVGNYNLGREYERLAMEIIQDSEGRIGTKDNPAMVVVLVNAYAQDLDQNILYSGIQESFEQENDSNLEVKLELVTVDDTNTFSIEESVRDLFMGKELPDIIICLDELTTTCAYQTIVDYNRVGDVNILGYYDSETILNAIDRNVIYATLSMDAGQMGAYCVNALEEYYTLGYTSQYFTADVDVICRDNVQEYVQKGETADENQ